ncbi:ribonuclease H-like domain-containing protein [Rhizophagus irregularis DAOM 181602=DAOM 197198]|nr:ribonuclease H-like domain-containing protein [Rhizophagus irregularis DAOM 181602=DAOM 197198]
MDQFNFTPTIDSSFYDLTPCLSSPPTTKNWIVTLDDYGSPIFGKQLLTFSLPWLRCSYSFASSKKRNADLTLYTAIAPDTPVTIESSAAAVFANSPLVISSDSRYIFFTDGSLINLGTPDVSMGWSWMQIVPDAGFPNSIATYAHGLIRDNPSSSRAEAAAIYAVLTISPRDSEVTIYTDSQTAIDGLQSCFSSIYSNSRLYYKTTNFELWAIIERTILSKNLTVLPVKVKAHSGNYLNDFADSLANTAHTASSSILISGMDLASAHDFVLIYDNDVVYYIVDWELTWFTLNFKPSHDASFTPEHASRHLTFKFKLFLDDLPTLEKLKRTRPDLYMDELTCRSSSNLVDTDLTPFIAKLTSLSCWFFLLQIGPPSPLSVVAYPNSSSTYLLIYPFQELLRLKLSLLFITILSRNSEDESGIRVLMRKVNGKTR